MISFLKPSRLNLVVAGHVDHGKSTLVGRLLADTGSVPGGKLDHIRALCERTSRPFEYAFLLDALKDERAQGITIDAARVFFKTSSRHYVVVDAPGHTELLKNMITGAARADAALLVIDAHEGVQENSCRHATMLSLLGIRQVAIVVNKMDLADYRREAFDGVVERFGAFLTRLGVTARAWIPSAARLGANVVERGAEMPWFKGPTILEVLETFEAEQPAVARPFRMAVQDVYKFTNFGDDRRIIAGTVQSGRVRVGDELVFYPAGKHARVVTVEAFNVTMRADAVAGQATGLTVEPQVHTTRGDMAVRANEPGPQVTSRIRASLFWLGHDPLSTHHECLLKLGTASVPACIETIHRLVNASDLSQCFDLRQVGRNEVAECTLKLQRAVAFDLTSDLAATGRFVLVDDYDIRGGGIVLAAMPDHGDSARTRLGDRRELVPGHVSCELRTKRYSQRPTLVLVVGEGSTAGRELARQLEFELFDEGRFVYFLGTGRTLFGADADRGGGDEEQDKHFRRLGEVANILLDAGLIVIVSVAKLTEDGLDTLKAALPANSIYTVWVGDRGATNLQCDGVVSDHDRWERGVQALKTLLETRGGVSKPW